MIVTTTNKERAAMELALEALEKIAYDTANPDTEKAITALREALAVSVQRTEEQAEQEPVAYAGMIDGSVCAVYTQWPVSHYHKIKPLYAHPVRTKDLTDDEIMKINVDTAGIVPTCDRQFHFARAVIQEYRRKNGIV